MAYTEQYNGIFVDNQTGAIAPAYRKTALTPTSTYVDETGAVHMWGENNFSENLAIKRKDRMKSKEQENAEWYQQYLDTLSEEEREKEKEKRRQWEHSQDVQKQLATDQEYLLNTYKQKQETDASSWQEMGIDPTKGIDGSELFPTVESEKERNTKIRFPEEENYDFLRNYFDVVSGKINLLSNDPVAVKYKEHFASSNPSWNISMSRFKNRSIKALWELNPEWKGNEYDHTHILNTPQGFKAYTSMFGSDEAALKSYAVLKTLPNSTLIKNYPEIFDNIMMYSLGEYYGKMRDAYTNNENSTEDNKHLGASAWSENVNTYKTIFRVNQLTDEINKAAKKEGLDPNNLTEQQYKALAGKVNIGGWNRFSRNFQAIGAATARVIGDWASILGDSESKAYINPQKDAAEEVISQVTNYFNSKDTKSESIEKDAERFDVLAEQIYGNYNKYVKDLMSTEEKATKLKELQTKAMFSKTSTIENELSKYLQNKEYEDEGLLDATGTTLNKIGTTIIGTTIQVTDFLGYGAFNVGRAALSSNFDLGDALKETLDNAYMNYASDLESTGSWNPLDQNEKKEGKAYTKEELEHLVELGIIDSIEEGQSLRKDVGETWGVWIRAAGKENSFTDWANLQDLLGVAVQMVGVQTGSSILNKIGQGVAKVGTTAMNAASTARNTRVLLGASKLWNIPAYGGSTLGWTLKNSGNILRAEAPVLSNAGLNLGYAKSRYDEDIQTGKAMVQSDEFKQRVGQSLQKTQAEDLEMLYNKYGKEIEVQVQREVSKLFNSSLETNQTIPLASREQYATQVRNNIINEYYQKYIVEPTLKLETDNYLKESQRQAIIDAGTTHFLTSAADGVVAKTWQAALYGTEANWAYKAAGIRAKRLSNKLLNKVGIKTSKTSNKDFLKKTFGVKEVNTTGEIIEEAPFTLKDFYLAQIKIAKGGFISNYAQDLAVGGGKRGYEGMMEQYLNTSLDGKNNQSTMEALNQVLSNYYLGLQGQGIITAAGEARSILDGCLGAFGGFMVSPTSFVEARMKKDRIPGSKGIMHDLGRSIGILNLTRYAKENVLEMNMRATKNREIIQNWIATQGIDLFTSLASMNNYNIGLKRSTNTGDVIGQQDASAKKALETAYMVSIMEGTEFYNTAMDQLNTLLEIGNSEANIDNINQAIQALQNSETLEQALQDNPKLKEYINFLGNINYTAEMSLDTVKERWDNAIENAKEMKQMIEDNLNNRQEAIRYLSDYNDPILTHAFTQMLSYRDHLKRKVSEYQDNLKKEKESTLEILQTTENAPKSSGHSIYNIIYKSRATINSALEQAKNTLESLNTKLLKNKEALIKARKSQDNDELLSLQMQTIHLANEKLLTERKIQRLKEAQKQYKDLEEDSPTPFISATDILKLNGEELLDFLEHLDNVSDDQYKEFLKIQHKQAEISDEQAIREHSKFEQPDIKDNNYFQTLLSLKRYTTQLEQVRADINAGVVHSNRFTHYYSNLRNAIASSAFTVEYRNALEKYLEDNNLTEKEMRYSNWKQFYRDTMTAIESTPDIENNPDKVEMEKQLRKEALNFVLDSVFPSLSQKLTTWEDQLFQAQQIINNIENNKLSKEEKQILTDSLDALYSTLEDIAPTVGELQKVLNKGLEDSQVQTVLNKAIETIEKNSSRTYTPSDLLILLQQYINTYNQEISDTPNISTPILTTPDGTVIDINEEPITPKKTEETEEKKQKDREKLNLKFRKYLNQLKFTDSDIEQMFAEGGYSGVKLTPEMISKIKEVLQKAKETLNPADTLQENINNTEEGSALKGFLAIAYKVIENSRAVHIEAAPKDIIVKPEGENTGIQGTVVELISEEALPEELKTIYKDKEVFSYLSVHSITPSDTVVFMNTSNNSEYVQVLLKVSDPNTLDFSDKINGTKYQLLGFVPKSSNALFNNDVEGTILQSNNKEVEAKVQVDLIIHKDEDNPTPIVLTADTGKATLPSRFKVVDKQLKFKLITASNDTSVHSAEWGTATQVPILKTKNKEGKTLQELEVGEHKNFNSRFTKLAEIFDWLQTKLVEPDVDLKALQKTLNDKELTWEGNGGDKYSLANAVFLANNLEWRLSEKDGIIRLTIAPTNGHNIAILNLTTLNNENQKVFKGTDQILADLVNLLSQENNSNLMQWQIPHWYYAQTEKNQKFQEENGKKVIKDIEEGLLQIIPAKVESASVKIFSITDNSKPKPVITTPVTPSQTVSPAKVNQAEHEARWQNFVQAMTKQAFQGFNKIIGQAVITKKDPNHVSRGSSGREGGEVFNPEQQQDELALSLASGLVVDAIYRDVFNTLEGTSNYENYKQFLLRSEHENIVKAALKAKEHIKKTLGVTHFFLGDLNYINPKDKHYYGSPDLVCMDELGRIIIIDVKTAKESEQDFQDALNGKNQLDLSAKHIYAYNQQVTEYALKTEQLASYFNAAIPTINIGYILYIPTAGVTTSNYTITSKYIEATTESPAQRTYTFIRNKGLASQFAEPTDTKPGFRLFPIDIQKWRAQAWNDMTSKSGWTDLSGEVQQTYTDQSETDSEFALEDMPGETNTSITSTQKPTKIEDTTPVDEGPREVTSPKPVAKMPTLNPIDVVNNASQADIDLGNLLIDDAIMGCGPGETIPK